MVKKNKLVQASMAAALSVSAIVVPTVAQASETVVEPTKVAFTVDGEVKIIKVEDYITALMGGNAALLAEISSNGKKPEITGVVIDGKFVSPETYVTAYMSGNSVTSSELENVEELSTENAKELVDGEWVPVATDEIPEEKVNETFFYNLAA